MAATESGPAVVLIQGDDFDGYSAWFAWWLGTSSPHVWKVFGDEERSARAALDAALPTPAAGERLDQALARAFHGAFARPSTERELMARLADALLPDGIPGLRALLDAGREVEIRITPAPSCAHVPWALLVIDDGTGRRVRLGDVATIVDEVPAAFHVGRARVADDVEDAPVVTVIDPDLGVPRTRLFTDDQRRALAIPGGDAPGSRIDAWALSDRLREPTRAFVFVGHVEGAAGGTSMRLSPAIADGLPPDAALGRLSAADLVLGTSAEGGDTGAALWPMPARVAIVACNSGGDLGRREPFGLVVSCLNAGARWAVATRWVLPSDRAFRAGPVIGPADPQPLAEVAAAVAAATNGQDGTRLVVGFVRACLRRWEELPDDAPQMARVAASPLTWGALAVFRAERREVRAYPDDALLS